MKKKLVLIAALAVLVALTGCAGLDKQDASKGQKTAESAGFGAVVGGIAGKLLGVNPIIGAVFGGMVGGFAEYIHATNVEIAAAQKQAAALKQAGIESEVKTAEVKIKDKSGEVKTTQELKTFVVHDTGDTAVNAVADVAQGSTFGGKVVIVAPARDKERIETGIKNTLTGKKMSEVSMAFFTPEQAAKFGARQGVAWVPVHPTTFAAVVGNTKARA